MIATISVADKSFGNKRLLHDLHITIQAGEKVGLIGRNGAGKSTLFQIMSGADTDYAGEVIYRRGTVVVATRQEHQAVAGQRVIDYVLSELPEYAHLQHIMTTYPGYMGASTHKIAIYSDAVERFSNLGFYEAEDEVRRSLAGYQLDRKAEASMGSLSGGERRFVELVKLKHAQADLFLIDEPTNHMDYIAKEQFVKWLARSRQAVVVITHDRDVLRTVDRILELDAGAIRSFPGNYEAYLRQNSISTMTEIHHYEASLRRITELDKKIAWARARKPSWHGTADQRNPFEALEQRCQREKQEILDNLKRPNFWVDQESLAQMDAAVVEKYQQFKAKTIGLRTQDGQRVYGRALLSVDGLSLGYQGSAPLFAGCHFTLHEGERLELRGRNGAGKSTLIEAVVASAQDREPKAHVYAGSVTVNPRCRIGRYEQELGSRLLGMTLAEAIEAIYDDLGLPLTEQLLMQTLSQYLFDPRQDRSLRVSQLSGGQKSRLQLIRMLAGKPNLLILDEPTNHLDLPSIEELEQALLDYSGAILYVSHDSYFQQKIGGQVLPIGQSAVQ